MVTCQHYQDQLWDYLFDLVEGDEAEQLRRHLIACPACQEERVRLEDDQRALARAALLDVEIPLFVAPKHDQQSVLHSEETATVPPRHWVRHAFPWLAAAAAVLLALGGWQSWFRNPAAPKLPELAAEPELATAVGKLREHLRANEQELQQAKMHEGQRHLRLQVQGPAVVHRGEEPTYLVRASNLNGDPLDVEFTARLRDTQDRVVFEKAGKASRGEGSFVIPASLNLPISGNARLEVVANGPEQEKLEQVLELQGPAYITALTLDKAIYQPEDKLFFRSVTVERYSLRPPSGKLGLIYTITTPDGKTMKPATGLTHEGGVGGAEFAVLAFYRSGEYILTVREEANRFKPVSRHFWIHRQNEALTNAKSTTKTLNVHFFPEGGDLVAGLPSRVYWQVEGLSEKDQQISGVVEDSNHREVARLEPGLRIPHEAQMLGSFVLTPSKSEVYSLKLQTAEGTSTHKLPLVVGDVTLHIKDSVIPPNQRLRVQVASTGPTRELLVAVSCRGRLLDQQVTPNFDDKRQGECVLNVPSDAFGVLRVTVLENRFGRLWPLAERLAYRMPEKPLNIQLDTDRKTYRPGEQVTLTFRTAQPTWLAASVVDESALQHVSRQSDSGLPATFLLGPSINTPADLEMSLLATHDTPESHKTLDLVLGTKGWRRFYRGSPDDVLAKSNSTSGNELGLVAMDNIEAASKRANDSLASVRQRTEASTQALLADIRKLKSSSQSEELANLVQHHQDVLQQLAFAGGQSSAVAMLAAKDRGSEQGQVNIPLGPGQIAKVVDGPGSIAFVGADNSNAQLNAKPIDQPLPIRQYAYTPGAASESQHTILWSPLLTTKDGAASVKFTLPQRAAKYQIQIEGHTATGQVGAARQILNVQK